MVATITAPITLWGNFSQVLKATAEKSSPEAGSLNSTINIHVVDSKDPHAVFETESGLATSRITTEYFDEVQCSGSDQFLLSATEFSQVIGVMPTSAVTATLEFNPNEAKATFITDDGTKFLLAPTPIVSDDLIPQAMTTIPDDATQLKIDDFSSFCEAVKVASSMAQDPLKSAELESSWNTACHMDYCVDGFISLYSLDTSAALATCKVEEVDKGDTTLSLMPAKSTVGLLKTILQAEEKNEVFLYLLSRGVMVESYGMLVTIFGLTSRSTQVPKNKSAIYTVTEGAKSHYKTHAIVDASDIQATLSMAATKHPEYVQLDCDNGVITIKVIQNHHVVFSRDLYDVSDDVPHVFFTGQIRYQLLKKALQALGTKGTYYLEFSEKDNGSPWAALLSSGDQLDDNRFIMCGLAESEEMLY